MSIHIGAEKGDIAETILLPGDPMRAKHFAETMLEGALLFNEVRGMYGYTGTYDGARVSIMGTGMGLPSTAIYANELIREYGCKNLIRVGSCGGFQEDLKPRDIVIAMSASSNSAMNRLRFGGADYAPTASFELLKRAYDIAEAKGIPVRVGNILSNDSFYEDDPDGWKKWAEYGVLAVEMESSALYTIAAKYRVNALTICTVSDSLVTGEADSAETRETAYKKMFEIALALAKE